MAEYFVQSKVGTLKVKNSVSNDMFTIPGIYLHAMANYTVDDFVSRANKLLAIGGKQAVKDANARFDSVYKGVNQ